MSTPSFGGDGFRTEQELRGWAADVESKAQRYQDMQAQVAAVVITESSRDDVVRVTVDASGSVTALVISDEHTRLSGAELSNAVLTTMRRAQARITGAVAEVMEQTVGDDPDTVAAVVGSYRERFPEPEPEELRHSGSAVEEMTFDRPADDTPESPRRPPRRPRPDTGDDENPWGDGNILR
ncbi:YbaB/EbfC family nucleoid-associated protein [Actinokineospora sp. G85]|uniref:YbaB/EbfC family nucleoid-associated protein n=1 Tax=Actinokineospora sp. G85 TaxID=3406626 RepID=UPI003C72B29E